MLVRTRVDGDGALGAVVDVGLMVGLACPRGGGGGGVPQSMPCLVMQAAPSASRWHAHACLHCRPLELQARRSWGSPSSRSWTTARRARPSLKSAGRRRPRTLRSRRWGGLACRSLLPCVACVLGHVCSGAAKQRSQATRAAKQPAQPSNPHMHACHKDIITEEEVRGLAGCLRLWQACT